VNRSLAANDTEFVSTDMAAVIPKLQAVLQENADLAYCRLISPRKLEANMPYHAFVMPVFEGGRRAGLNLALDNVPATMSAWDPGARPEGQSFPYYHRWFFRTGETGDFETLVRLLVPKPVDRRVGFREMDVTDPGSNVPGLDKPELEGILKLGGALQPPDLVPKPPPDKYETWDIPYPRPLQTKLAELINLPDLYQAQGDPDPLIGPPLYGRWHALVSRVLENRDGTPVTPVENWLSRLNLDPRFRVAAGIGTRVIQDKQENYMNAAWEQIGKVLEAQRRIWFAQFGLRVSHIWHERHLMPMLAVSHQQTLLLMAPLNKRILSDGLTVHANYASSFVVPAMTSAPMRRIIRPRARLMQMLPFDAARPAGQLIDRVNAGEISAAPPKETPAGVVTPDKAADMGLPGNAPPLVLDWLTRFPNLPLWVLIAAIILALLALLLLPFAAGVAVAAVIVLVGIALYQLLKSWAAALKGVKALHEDGQTPETVNLMPSSPDFVISDVGSGFRPSLGGTDSVEAVRFKDALRDGFTMMNESKKAGVLPLRKPLDLAAIAGTMIDMTEPRRTIPRRVNAGLFIPPGIYDDLVLTPEEVFVEPMAYPIIDQPMYEPLKDLSSEYFLPNINLIEHNSITLLQTNQRFIEAYMVGLNHEFARELLWREYPTDQRGSTFRQFWDVRSFFNTQNLDKETLKESLRDIPPLHLWSKNSKLGDHDHREQGRENEDELVLVIRGELLKRYPNAVIYAHRACWQHKAVTPADDNLEPCERSGPMDNTVERRFVALTPAEEQKPPRSKVLTPLYEAKVDPDIYFFGFDLTVDKAQGGTGENPNDDPGWFFVIKERPGEPRFGLDGEVPKDNKLEVWNDLSWPKLQPTGSFIDIAGSPATLAVTDPGSNDEKYPQYKDDRAIQWNRGSITSAELGYILFQAPVLVGVHASEMLPK
jgi:hypothetical protein